MKQKHDFVDKPSSKTKKNICLPSSNTKHVHNIFIVWGITSRKDLAKAKESNQPLVFLFEEPPLERMLVKS